MKALLSIHFWIVLFFGGVLFLIYAEKSCAESGTVYIVDGDTIHTETAKIRLYGIDAPEMDQPHGKEAAEALADLMEGGDFLEVLSNKDRYRRDVSIIAFRDPREGTTIQAAMINQGHAWVYPQYCTRPECGSWKRLERIAREERRGLWANPVPVPPWEWRRDK